MIDEAWENVEKANELYEKYDLLGAADLYFEAANIFKKSEVFQNAGWYYRKAGEMYIKQAKAELKSKPNGNDADNVEKNRKNEIRKEFRILEKIIYAHECYHESRVSFKNGGIDIQAHRSYIKEKDAYRMLSKRAFSRKIRKSKEKSDDINLKLNELYQIYRIKKRTWIGLTLYKAINYGESLPHFALWVSGFIVLFTIVYFPSKRGCVQIEGANYGSSWIDKLAVAFYYSIITLIGYENLSPANTITNFVISSGVIIGFVIFGIFIVMITKRLIDK